MACADPGHFARVNQLTAANGEPDREDDSRDNANHPLSLGSSRKAQDSIFPAVTDIRRYGYGEISLFRFARFDVNGSFGWQNEGPGGIRAGIRLGRNRHNVATGTIPIPQHLDQDISGSIFLAQTYEKRLGIALSGRNLRV